MVSSYQRKCVWGLPLLVALVLGLALLSSSLGSYEAVRAPQVLHIIGHWLGLSHGSVNPDYELVVRELRLPRVALGILTGAALAMAGAVLQGLFRNPLADPALIGVSSGAAVGAVAMIVLGGAAVSLAPTGWAAFALPLAALAGGLLVTVIIYQLAKVEGRTHLTLMLLTGIALNALAGSVIGLMVYLATDEQLRKLIFWSLGSLSQATWPEIGVATLLALPGMLILPWLARPLNALLLGEAEAFHVGVPVQQVKRLLIFLSALTVGATVAVCGTIGFVGLMAPHLARLVFGPDHRVLLPASALIGAALLLAADVAARLAAAGADELPIGVVTALAGAPIFLALLMRARRSGGF
jgi:iron complex transport system permease protein